MNLIFKENEIEKAKQYIGKTIKAYDFPPIEGRDEYFAEGVVTNVYSYSQYKMGCDCFEIKTDDGAFIMVPLFTSFDFENRIQLLN